MGSPISPIFAEFFMQYLEESIILNDSRIAIWKRYVDDIFTALKEDDVNDILLKLNSFSNPIKFTVEIESANTLNYLDASLIHNESGTISKKVYRKPTHSGIYINYRSFHHQSHKLSVIDSLAYRAFKICDQEFLENELKHIREQLINNGYPNSLITKRFELMKTKFQINYKKPDNVQNPRIILPFIGNLTTKVSKYLRRKLNCDFGYIPGKKIRNLICNHKEKSRKDLAGVYKISCSCNYKYIGETYRDLNVRFKEHLDSIKRKNHKSAISTHLIRNTSHKIEDSASLIIKEKKNFHRKFYESILMQSERNLINLDKGMEINDIISTYLIPLATRLTNENHIKHDFNWDQ